MALQVRRGHTFSVDWWFAILERSMRQGAYKRCPQKLSSLIVQPGSQLETI